MGGTFRLHGRVSSLLDIVDLLLTCHSCCKTKLRFCSTGLSNTHTHTRRAHFSRMASDYVQHNCVFCDMWASDHSGPCAKSCLVKAASTNSLSAKCFQKVWQT